MQNFHVNLKKAEPCSFGCGIVIKKKSWGIPSANYLSPLTILDAFFNYVVTCLSRLQVLIVSKRLFLQHRQFLAAFSLDRTVKQSRSLRETRERGFVYPG